MAWYDTLLNAGSNALGTMGQGAFDSMQGYERDPYEKPRGMGGFQDSVRRYADEKGLTRDFNDARDYVNNFRKDPRAGFEGMGRGLMGAADGYLREHGIENTLGRLFNMGRQLYNDPRKALSDAANYGINYAKQRGLDYMDSRGIRGDVNRGYGMMRQAYQDPRGAMMAAGRYGARQLDNHMGYNRPQPPQQMQEGHALGNPAMRSISSSRYPQEQQQYARGGYVDRHHDYDGEEILRLLGEALSR